MEHMVSEGGIVIFNPTAGRGQAAALREAAQARLGPGFEWRATQRAGHASELAKIAAGEREVVVAFGGDGTVGDVMRGIHGTDATLGILPVGTGNDVARNLGIPLEIGEACATILSGVTRRIDLGTINGKPFINNAGTGFDAHVMIAMNNGIRFTKGQPAFVLATLKTLPGFKPFTLTIEADDAPPETEKAMLVSVLNGTMYGGGMLAAPYAEVDDGFLDILIIRAQNKFALLSLMPKVIAGKHIDHPAVKMLKVRKAKITTTPAQPLNIDGDVSGLTPAEIEVLPRALKVLVR